jgi:hypothetical protein
METPAGEADNVKLGGGFTLMDVVPVAPTYLLSPEYAADSVSVPVARGPVGMLMVAEPDVSVADEV